MSSAQHFLLDGTMESDAAHVRSGKSDCHHDLPDVTGRYAGGRILGTFVQQYILIPLYNSCAVLRPHSFKCDLRQSYVLLPR